jgi:hypothetical protein
MSRIKEVYPLEGYLLKLVFTNGEVRCFDMNPYLKKGIFVALQDAGLFRRVKPAHGTIEWPGEIDMCPDTLYLESVPFAFSVAP